MPGTAQQKGHTAFIGKLFPQLIIARHRRVPYTDSLHPETFTNITAYHPVGIQPGGKRRVRIPVRHIHILVHHMQIIFIGYLKA